MEEFTCCDASGLVAKRRGPIWKRTGETELFDTDLDGEQEEVSVHLAEVNSEFTQSL